MLIAKKTARIQSVDFKMQPCFLIICTLYESLIRRVLVCKNGFIPLDNIVT